MGRNVRAMLTASRALLLFLAARVFGKKPLPPPVDPFKERITFLQKQLPGRQIVRNATGRTEDGQAGTTRASADCIISLDAQRTAALAANQRFAKSRSQRRAPVNTSPLMRQAA